MAPALPTTSPKTIFAEAVVGRTADRKDQLRAPDRRDAVAYATDQRELTYYDLSVGWNVLPGEVFFGRKRAMPSAVYVTMGAGSTRFAGDDRFTATVGAGLRLLVNDWLAVHVDARDRMFKTDLLGRQPGDSQPGVHDQLDGFLLTLRSTVTNAMRALMVRRGPAGERPLHAVRPGRAAARDRPAPGSPVDA